MADVRLLVFPLMIPSDYQLRMDRIRHGTEPDANSIGFPWPPRGIPWPIVAPHEAQAYHNHKQSLERLAARGGLDPAELVAVLEDRPWTLMPTEAAVRKIRFLALARAALGHREHPPADKTCTCGLGPWCLASRKGSGDLAQYVLACGYCYHCGGFDGGAPVIQTAAPGEGAIRPPAEGGGG